MKVTINIHSLVCTVAWSDQIYKQPNSCEYHIITFFKGLSFFGIAMHADIVVILGCTQSDNQKFTKLTQYVTEALCFIGKWKFIFLAILLDLLIRS